MANIVRRGEQSRPLAPSFRGGAEWDPLRMVRDMLRWDPFAEMAPFGADAGLAYAPQFEVKETPTSYIFKGDLPGVKDANLEIAVTGNRLTISGKREAEEKSEGETYYAYERSYGAFSRTFTLPDGVDTDHVQADLKAGVLTMMLPKVPEMQAKKISVKSAGGKETGKA